MGLLLLSESLPRPSVVLVVVVLQVGLLHVVALEDGFALTGSQVVSSALFASVSHTAKI